MLKVDAIIQARVGSSRLPNKVIKKISNLFIIYIIQGWNRHDLKEKLAILYMICRRISCNLQN